MTREEKIKLAIEKGYTCDPATGKVYGVRGMEITKKPRGYIIVTVRKDKKDFSFFGHQFVWYWVHGEIVNCIDHINRIRDDNRIDNLRSVTVQQNQFNTNAKGYCWDKSRKKWMAYIVTNDRQKYLGRYDTEEEARAAYLEAKQKHHLI